jgi:hypothetical protein
VNFGKTDLSLVKQQLILN